MNHSVTDAPSPGASPRSDRTSIAWLLAIAAWVGLGYGMIEGVESFILSLLPHGLSWQNGNSAQALMYMPVLYFLAYQVIGLAFVPLALTVRKGWWDLVLVFLLVALSAYLAARNQRVVFNQTSSMILGVGIGVVATRIYRKKRERWRGVMVRRLPIMAGLAAALIGGTFFTLRIHESRQLAALPQPEKGRPNVLLIIMDTQRGDHLSSYGYHRPTSPSLDSLATQGMLFEQAYATSSWTLPSHASIFTGRMVHEHQAGAANRRALPTTYPTLAERLGEQGYATGGFTANIFWTPRHTGLNRGFITYADYYGTPGDAMNRMALVRDMKTVQQWLGLFDIRGRKRAGDINAEFLGWLDRIEGRPFFAFLNYFDVHSPYLPPPSFAGRFGEIREDMQPRRLEIGDAKDHKQSPERIAYKLDRYDESMLSVDHQLGLLMAELGRRGVLDNTIVIVTADHGEHFGEHGIVEHGASLYAQETRVPLIIRYPPSIPAGSRATYPVILSNLPATITSLAGIADTTFPGRSVVLAPDTPGPLAVPLVAEMAGNTGGNDPPNWPASKGWVKSLVADRWHFLLMENGEVELFDLIADPAEANNLAATAAGQVTVERMRKDLQAISPTTRQRASNR